jgi:hypothetical protein
MRIVFRELKTIARAAWQWLREWSGDSAYEQYCRRITARGGMQTEIPSAEEFYLDSVRRRFSRPSRCC